MLAVLQQRAQPCCFAAAHIADRQALAPLRGSTDLSSWREHIGEPQYNLVNPCCLALNKPRDLGMGGWGAHLIPTFGVQLTMAHLLLSADGRASDASNLAAYHPVETRSLLTAHATTLWY